MMETLRAALGMAGVTAVTLLLLWIQLVTDAQQLLRS
jgi:hypothetical protein